MIKKEIKLIIFILLIVFTLFSLSLFNEILSEKISETHHTTEPRNLFFKKMIELNKTQNLKYLFLGDSHCYGGIKSGYIPNSYNFCFGGMNYREINYSLKYFNLTNKTKYIIINYDPHKFYQTSTILNKYKLIDDLNYFKKRFPIIENGKEFLLKIKFEFIDIKKNQRTNSEIIKSTNPTLKNIAPTTIFNHFINSKKNEKDNIQFLKNIIDKANKNNIRVILIKFPLSLEYFNEMKEKRINLKDIYFSVEQKLKTTKYLVLDESRTYINNSNYFHDPDHLNYEGSKIFSKKINKELQKIQ